MSGTDDYDNLLGMLTGIMSGQEPGGGSRGGLVVPDEIDVVAIRRKTGMTQAEFARSIAVPVGTLRNWEQRHREPKGPARVLLAMVDRNPRIVRETLAA